MVSLIEVANGVARAFATSSYRMYIEEPALPKNGGGEDDCGAVYITIEEIAESTCGGGRQSLRLLLVDLAFLKDEDLSQNEYYTFINACHKYLRPTFAFDGRKIAPKDISCKKADEVAHFTFELEFYDKLDIDTIKIDKMDEIKIRR